MSELEYFRNKRIWVTGASSGIGREIVFQLAPVAEQIIISGRNTNTLNEVSVQSGFTEKISVVIMDQGSPDSVQKACDIVLSDHGIIDVVFCNGGVSQRALAMETSEKIERYLFETNYFSQIQIAKSLVKAMDLSRRLHIVVTSSLLGKWGFPLRSSYAATKHALHGYFDSLRMENKERGLQVTLVLPGFINTPISKHAMNAEGKLSGEMDANQAGGISVQNCVEKILAGVASKKSEFSVGGRETLGLLLRRYLPSVFEKILMKKKPR